MRKDFIWIMAGLTPCELYRQRGYFSTDRAHLRLLSQMACQEHWLTSLIELFFPEALAEFLQVTPISLTPLASQFWQHRPTMMQRTPQRGTLFQVCGSHILKKFE